MNTRGLLALFFLVSFTVFCFDPSFCDRFLSILLFKLPVPPMLTIRFFIQYYRQLELCLRTSFLTQNVLYLVVWTEGKSWKKFPRFFSSYRLLLNFKWGSSSPPHPKVKENKTRKDKTRSATSDLTVTLTHCTGLNVADV